jgi:diaminohydroxyphosphoribosylaminopyrimidine deaminase/5-amino-6-(5-phosphoribosylamino)uracil reductase
MKKPLLFMQRALELARQGEGRTAPNPPVGAVIVRHDRVIGEGFHPAAGEPHAEIFALRQAGASAAGATLYATLEPCCHQGKTPPCADALIAAGIEQVFVGVEDPNPQVAGRGIERLRRAGISVEVGLLEAECRRLIAAFTKHLATGRPLTFYKTAMTLDGNTAAASGDAGWISGEQSRRRVHQLRDRVEAIMIGIGTLLQDDPQLTTRLSGDGGRDPLRVVIDSHLRTPPESRLLHQNSNAGTLIATISDDGQRCASLERAGAEVFRCRAENGRVSLDDVWTELGRRGVQQLLLEGGAQLAGAALHQGLIDRMLVFVAPKLLGGRSSSVFGGNACATIAEAIRLHNLSCEPLGEDFLVTGEIDKCSPD